MSKIDKYIKAIESIEATLENRATVDQQSYSFKGRQIEKIPIAELIQLHQYYKKLLSEEKEIVQSQLGINNRMIVNRTRSRF